MRFSTLLFANAISLVSSSPLGGLTASSLGLASWDIEGYAKDNPLGKTTGGEGGEEVHVKTAAEFLKAIQGDEPRIIYVKGMLELPERARVGWNKSILGVGWKAHIKENGITVNGTGNVIIRNLKISHIKDQDCISINNSTRLWVDHNEFESAISEEIGPDFYVSACPIDPRPKESKHADYLLVGRSS